MWLSPHGPGTGGRLSPKAAVSVFHLGFCHSDLMTELLLPVSIILSITLKPEALWLGPWGASGAGAGSWGRKFPALPGSLWNGNPILFTSLRREFGPFWAKQKSPTKALPYWGEQRLSWESHSPNLPPRGAAPALHWTSGKPMPVPEMTHGKDGSDSAQARIQSLERGGFLFVFVFFFFLCL